MPQLIIYNFIPAKYFKMKYFARHRLRLNLSFCATKSRKLCYK